MTLENPAIKGQALRLLDHLVSHPTSETAEIRRRLGIGNIADTAFKLNARLALAGDPRRAVCNHRGRTATWRLDTAQQASA